MNFRFVCVSAACLAILVVPASTTSLMAAAAAVKGAVVGAALGALKSSGGSETVIIQSEPGSIAEVVPAGQVVVQNPVTIHNGQIISYASSNPISRLWSAISESVAAKAKAISNIFRPNRVVIVVPQTTTTTTTTEKPIITIDLEHKPLLPGINIDVVHKPINLPTVDIEVNHKPLPSIEFSAALNKPRFVQPVAVVNYLKK